MTSEERDLLERFPRSAKYSPDWLKAGASGGANPLWLAEWLAEELELSSDMRVLDLGCGRARSSIFLHREFRAEVWATDLWFSEVRDTLHEDRILGCPQRCCRSEGRRESSRSNMLGFSLVVET